MAKINAINNKSGDLTIDPGASGDSFVQFDINGTGEFRIGVDDTDDSFRISTGSALGTTDTFIVASAGERTMPLQPAVLADISSDASNVTGDGTTYTVAFDQERFDQNNDFNTGTYTFTAPVTGRYFISASCESKELTSSHTTGLLECITSNRTYLFEYCNMWVNSFTGLTSPYGSCLADMDASDTATIEITISGGTKVVDLYGTDTFVRCGLSIYLVC